MRIKNWKKHQHFKDRKPPWIKLYREILDDIEWHELEPSAAKVLVMLWLIASESNGELPGLKTLSFRLRMPEKDVISSCNLLKHWLGQDDISAISEEDQSDSVERETETEEETDILSPENQATTPVCPHLEILELFGKHLPELPQPMPNLWEGARAKALQQRWKWVMANKAKTKEEGLDFFGRYFVYVSKSDFLSGRNGKWTACDLGWLVKADNFTKVMQGNYQNKEEQ